MLLAGCASTADIYASAVDDAVTSSKPLQEVSICLQLKYDTPPLTTAAGETTFALKNMQRVTLGTLSLRTVPEGTRVEMRRSGSVGALGNWRGCL